MDNNSCTITENEMEEPIESKGKWFKSYKFDQEWVQVLINLRMKHAKMFTRRRNSASEGWKLVFNEMRELGAPNFITMGKIKKKWMNLMSRFKQIKNSTLNPEKITWPYYEHINRAFGNTVQIQNENEEKSDFLFSTSSCERQVFIRKLIELRCTHKHLFTGKKYTAREGWIIIRGMLQLQEKYSIEQLSKCWQNMVQRYKQLSKTGTKITWPYYELMDWWYKNETSPNDIQTPIKVEKADNALDSEIESSTFLDHYGNIEMSNGNVEINNDDKAEMYDKLVSELEKLKQIQEINHRGIIHQLKNIENSLNSLKEVNNLQ